MKLPAFASGLCSIHFCGFSQYGTAHHQLAMIDAVAHPPLHVERRQTGVADDRLVAGRRAFHPVCQMAAIAGARGRLPRAIDEGKPLDRFIGGIVDVVRWSLQGIAENVERELLAVAGRAAVVGGHDDEPRMREQVIVPAIGNRIAPRTGESAVHQHQQRILLRLVELRRQRDVAVNAPAVPPGEPEIAKRQPVDRRGLRGIERRQELPFFRCGIDPYDLDRVDGTFPVGHQQRRRSARRDVERRVDPLYGLEHHACAAPPATGTE